jgi:hypothetical protein
MYGLRVPAGTGGEYHTLVDTLTHWWVQGVHSCGTNRHWSGLAEAAAPTQL